MRRIKFLSIVIPSYKQEKTIKRNLEKVEESLKEIKIPYEIIVVVDGTIDNTYEKLKKIKSKKIKILKYKENKGKGFAVRHGMLQAKGDVIGFIDAGFDINPNGISMLLNHMIWYNADIIIGSKLHPVSQVNYPIGRKVLSWGYRSFTHFLFGFNVKDTQVGVKLFKKKVVKQIFPMLLVKKFAFDVEILAVSYNSGFTRIYEAPIVLNFKGISTIDSKTFWKIILHMLWDTTAVFYRLKVISYYDKINPRKRNYLK